MSSLKSFLRQSIWNLNIKIHFINGFLEAVQQNGFWEEPQGQLQACSKSLNAKEVVTGLHSLGISLDASNLFQNNLKVSFPVLSWLLQFPLWIWLIPENQFSVEYIQFFEFLIILHDLFLLSFPDAKI